MTVEITEHADDRIKERLGLPKSARLKAAQTAFDCGKTHAEAKGKLKRYLNGCWLRHKNCGNVRMYGENIWFFAGETLVTLYEIPKNMRSGV